MPGRDVNMGPSAYKAGVITTCKDFRRQCHMKTDLPVVSKAYKIINNRALSNLRTAVSYKGWNFSVISCNDS